MTPRRPRFLIAAALVLLAAVIALFVIALLSSNAEDRRQAERRFRERAEVSAALTQSLFTSSAQAAAEQNSKRFGDQKVDTKALETMVKQSRLAYGLVLDERAVPIAVSSGVKADVVRRVAAKPEHIQQVLDGADFSASSFVADTGVLEYVAAFDTSHGKRYIVQGLSGTVMGAFFGGYLATLPGAEQTNAYLFDGEGKVIGSPVKDQAPGTGPKEAGLEAVLEPERTQGSFDGSDKRFATGSIEGTPWRVILTEPASSLYAGINWSIEWLILIALAAAGLAAVVLLARTVRRGEALRVAYADMEIANSELERTNVELTRSNAELEQFASVASHDLQEPLRKVQTFGDQLERRFGEEIPDEAKDYLQRMRRASARMSVLIEDLLRFSRVTTHARPPQRVDLAEVAREVTLDLDALLEETHGRVEVNGLPAVEADPLQMRQLLQNLIGNGLKFHRPGEAPVVTLKRAETDKPGMVAFAVSDNGIGFEPVYEDRIFRVFERLHPRDVYPGTGIGLALCRKIAERHGGSVSASSEPDHGSTFTVTLPAAPSGASAPAGRAALRQTTHA